MSNALDPLANFRATGIDLELSYLGACMTERDALEESTLTGDDFENVTIGKLFDALKERQAKGLGISQLSMVEAYPDHLGEIWKSTDAIGEVLLWPIHAETIRVRSVKRALYAGAVRMAQMVQSDMDPDDMIAAARKSLDDVSASRSTKVTSMLNDAQEQLALYRQHVETVPSPWRDLNEAITGFAKGRMYVFGARPGVGKSALASQIAYALAARGPVVFATMEMGRPEMYARILSQQAGVYFGALSQEGMSDFLTAKQNAWLANNLRDIRIIDDGTQTVASIRAATRAALRDGPVAGVLVDYIHLLSTPHRVDNEVQRINEITRELKQLSRDLDVPVIALSQLNRAAAARTGGRPTMEDLRGSGGIEQDADAIIMLYRDDAAGQAQNTISVSIIKNRQGPNFIGFDLEWQGQFVRAVDPGTVQFN